MKDNTIDTNPGNIKSKNKIFLFLYINIFLLICTIPKYSEKQKKLEITNKTVREVITVNRYSSLPFNKPSAKGTGPMKTNGTIKTTWRKTTCRQICPGCRPELPQKTLSWSKNESERSQKMNTYVIDRKSSQPTRNTYFCGSATNATISSGNNGKAVKKLTVSRRRRASWLIILKTPIIFLQPRNYRTKHE